MIADKIIGDLTARIALLEAAITANRYSTEAWRKRAEDAEAKLARLEGRPSSPSDISNDALRRISRRGKAV